MLTVFQGETGGYVEFQTNVATAVSGYLDVISPARTVYRFDGEVVSGVLRVSKSGIGQLPDIDTYACFPQVVDADSRIYFLTPADLTVVGYPDFFEYAVLTSGSSVLVRLQRLETLYSGQYPTVDKTYRHEQLVPDADVLVNHNLDKYPTILILDTAGDVCFGTVDYLNTNQLRVSFTSPFSGSVICN